MIFNCFSVKLISLICLFFRFRFFFKMADLYVALPPVTKNAVIFGKNANLPPTDVQQVIYCAAADHVTGSKVKVYLTKSKLQKKCFITI